MKRVVLIVAAAFVVLAGSLLFFFVGEGYPTWEAVENRFIDDGEIVVILPAGLGVESARCDDSDARVSVDGQVVTTKIGHSWCLISIDVELEGELRTIHFNPQKLNDWNRIRFVPLDPSSPKSAYEKIENGVTKGHSDVSWE